MTARMFFLRLGRKSIYITRRMVEAVAKLPNLLAHFLLRIEHAMSHRIQGGYASLPPTGDVTIDQVVFGAIPFNLAPLNPALPAVGRSGSITLLIPSLQKSSFFGGTATALIISAHLADKMGKTLRIVQTLQPGGSQGLDEFFGELGMPQFNRQTIEMIDISARRHNVYGYIDIHRDDEFVASAWWDAHLLDQLPRTRPYLYLIQDFEPIFYANGDKSMLAENTYRSERFVPLCNTRLMYQFMSERYPRIGRDGIWFEPAVARTPKHRPTAEKRRLFFYGRPSVERNLYLVGLLALDRAFTAGVLDPRQWEVVAAGQDRLPDVTLSSGMVVENLGKLSAEQYEDLVGTVDLAVSLMMAPHPNYPTLELASSGASVVTTRYETKADLSIYSPNIVMADLTVDGIVDGIRRAAQVSPDERYANALKPSALASSWSETLSDPVARVIQALGEELEVLEVPNSILR